MQKLQDFGKIVSVELSDAIKELNRTQDARGNFRTAIRLVVQFATSDNMTDAQRKLYERATPEQKRIMDANKVRISYSNLFNAENIITDANGNPFVTPNGGLSDEQQNAVLAKVKETFAKVGNTCIFTVYEFGINELTDGELDAVYTEEGVKLTSRSRLFFEFFDDDESAKRMIKTSLQTRLDDGELLASNPNDESAHAKIENTLNL